MEDAADFAFETESWANRLATACIERYNALPRAGKPGANEWAPLAGVVVFIPAASTENIAQDGGRYITKAPDSFNCNLNELRKNVFTVHAKSIGSSSLNASVPLSLVLENSNAMDSVPLDTSTADIEFNKKSIETTLQEVFSDQSTVEELPSKYKIQITSSKESATFKKLTKPASRGIITQGKKTCQSPVGVVTCVALGTGSKCLGGKELVCGGARIHDSHAEVLARRGFLRYLLHQAERALTSGDSEVLEAGPAGCRVRPGVSFHAFVSEPPCGDAAIFPSDEHAQRVAKERPPKRCRDEEDEDSVTSAKRSSLGLSKAELIVENIQKECTPENRHQCISPLAGTDTVRDFSITKNLELAEEHPDKNVCVDLSHSGSHQCEIANILRDSQEISQTFKESNKVSPNSTPNIVPNMKAILTVAQNSSTPILTSINSIYKPRIEETFASNVQSTMKEITQKTSQTTSEDLSVKSNNAAQVTGSLTPSDVHRTGAKCVGGGAQDKHAPGAGYHVTGAVRTKPGRGDPTLSLSCSDKMARWQAVGVQGALLSLLIPAPVRYRSVVHAGGVTWSATSLRRALAERACANPAPLALAQASLRSPAERGDGARPCAAGVVWCEVPQRSHEVVARGLKQGVTKKAANTSAGRLKICRKEMAKEFIRVYSSAVPRYPGLRLHISSLNKHMPNVGSKILGLKSLQSGSFAQNLRLNCEGPEDCAISINRCQHKGCQNISAGQTLDKDFTCDLISSADVCSYDLNSDKLKKCLANSDLLISSAAISSENTVLIASENVTNCGQQSEKDKSIAEVVRKMTYAQLKAMAFDYQLRWRHVREAHFPGWTVKPSGLQDFVIDD